MGKILVIDDDETNRELLRARLERAGHVLTEASNGADGLRLLETDAWDLVVLDVMMPHMDGWQVCRRIKGDPKTRHIPVLMLTACGMSIDQLRGWESGVDEYVTKPWDPSLLIALVDKWCRAGSVPPPEGRVLP